MQLAATPGRARFNVRKDPRAADRLQRLLERQSRYTENVKICNVSDVLLDHAGLVQGRFRLTTTALSQLCSRVVPYLSQVVYDLSGLRTPTDQADSLRSTDAQLAVRWLNDAIKLRFDQLYDCGLIVDHSNHRVEGVVGRKYAFLSNLDMYAAAERFVAEEYGRHAEFCEAVLAGRRIFVRFRSKEPIFEHKAPDGRLEPFFGGFHFSNSEIGECAVRACAVVIRQWCDNKAISPFCEGGKLTHMRGPRFKARLESLFDKVRVRANETLRMGDSVDVLESTPLLLGVNQAEHNKRFEKLKQRLTSKGVSATLAERSLRRAMSHGSFRQQAMLRGEPPLQAYAIRNAYDLFNALTHECKRCPPTEREDAEQLAYQMLLGRFNWS